MRLYELVGLEDYYHAHTHMNLQLASLDNLLLLLFSSLLTLPFLSSPAHIVSHIMPEHEEKFEYQSIPVTKHTNTQTS